MKSLDVRRWWVVVVDLATVAWIGLFIADIAAAEGLIALTESQESSVARTLGLLLVVFLFDIVLLYRWSDSGPRGFVTANWFWIITVVPWFRPLRVLRAGRGLRAVRVLAGTRRAGSLVNKLRRMGARLKRRFDE